MDWRLATESWILRNIGNSATSAAAFLLIRALRSGVDPDEFSSQVRSLGSLNTMTAAQMNGLLNFVSENRPDNLPSGSLGGAIEELRLDLRSVGMLPKPEPTVPRRLLNRVTGRRY